MNANKWYRRTEFILLFAGCLCAGYYLLVAASASAALGASRQFGNPREHQAGMPPSVLASTMTTAREKMPPPTTVIGRLEIPAISLSVPILSDYESASLLKGVGHIPKTAMPGGLGTVGLAGHRDTYFRPLRNIKRNMNIAVADQDGVYHYIVDSTEIVKPENVEVLDIGSRPGLTLITCYPFYYVGAAPLRYIVHAHLLSASPDSK